MATNEDNKQEIEKLNEIEQNNKELEQKEQESLYEKQNQIEEEPKEKKKVNIRIVLIIVLVSLIVIPLTIFVMEKLWDTVFLNRKNNVLKKKTVKEPIIDRKPIIYLYPEKPEVINVEPGKPECLTHTYPKYEKQGDWKVLAMPNGKLIDLNTKRKLYSLYYENRSDIDFEFGEEGFVVKGEDTIKFLEEKLAILGLNEYESQEMIIYWLPRLENNKYNYIRFASKEEIEENMPLKFSKEPDSLIRILMLYKPLNKKIEVKEQKLETPERKGFTVVEWGGSEISGNIVK